MTNSNELVVVKSEEMTPARRWANLQAGKVGWALLWLLGIPLPVLLVLYLIRGH